MSIDRICVQWRKYVDEKKKCIGKANEEKKNSFYALYFFCTDIYWEKEKEIGDFCCHNINQ